tara:strand:+ start:2376 stop:3149 length:774 start_codon:yes stop_codon:yes gene_type:complete
MKNFVISLTSATERRKHINHEFSKHNVNFEFFDALTPETAENYANSLGLNLNDIGLTLGELACMMSHVALWKKAIDENTPYITIFEDDVYLGEDANRLLNDSEWIKSDWNIIKIETVLKKTILAYKSYQVATVKREVTQLKSKHLGTGGYVLSLRGAMLFFDYINNTNLRPLDELIFEEFIAKHNEPVYQMKPALCIQEIILAGPNANLSLPSLLIEERKDRMKSDKIKNLNKARRELNRIILQTKKVILAKEIPFH